MSNTKDHLIGKLIGLSRMMEEKEYRSKRAEAMIWEGLVAAWTVDVSYMKSILQTVEEEMEMASPDCVSCKSCWPGNYYYDMDFVQEAEMPIRERKITLLLDLERLAWNNYRMIAVGAWKREDVKLVEKALKAIGNNVITAEELDAVKKEILKLNERLSE